ncbi:S1C family serine protease [Streptococcus cuniculipharyngis]|uniref:PDZ domain-containing protein n=1 Tax=Streptococcus cuniculipharyngis TaxID=1562651 RepID=A0A5C5SBG3_9STRE|nr:trypsin-like peptidase domain-containing protein [Streptococcus cuniculipharyngis]TWS97705.1 PDZ domain-containing protein [Streptococcus cuniculipharyngis]
MENKQSSPLKKLIKTCFIIGLGFLGGLLASLVVLQSNGNTTVTQVATTKVTSQNKTSTTEAVKVVQDAVVSVVNYQNASSTGNISSLFGQNPETNLNENAELQVAGEGSGVIYKKDKKYAYLVTNNHVIQGAEKIEILLADGTKAVGELIGSDTYSDLAVVRISAEKVKTVAQFADSSSLTVGETAIAIGSPLGSEYANSVTQGIVSSLSRTVTSTSDTGQTISTNAIQTDAAINPGNSGGALINIQGQVIGINSSKISATSKSGLGGVSVEGMGFAIPSNDVVEIIKQLEENGSVSRPALGISMVNLSQLSTSAISQLKIPADITSGIVVAAVQTGMPSEGKLEKYDVITEIDGQEVKDTSDLQSLLYKHSLGDKMTVTFYRGSEKRTETIKLTKSTQDLSN